MRRINGVDVARGLAVLGMFAAHVGPDPQAGGFESVLEIAHGRAPALFALLSIALLSERATVDQSDDSKDDELHDLGWE